MKVRIPTCGRPDKQPMAEALAAAGIPFRLVVPPSECRVHKWPVIVCPKTRIYSKRQWILDNTSDSKILMLDDDLKIRVRKSKAKFEVATPDELRTVVGTLAKFLDRAAHVGVIDSYMSHTRPRGYIRSGRYNQVLGYNKALFPDPPPTFRIQISEEHDFSLQLQSVGCLPIIYCEATKSEKPNAPGGCALWRTPEIELQAHRRLAELWPELVQIVPTKKSINGYRVKIRWSLATKVLKMRKHSLV